VGKIHKALTKAGAENTTTSGINAEKQSQQPAQRPAKQDVKKRTTRQTPSPTKPTIKPILEQEEGPWDERLQAATLSPGIGESFRRLRAQILHPSKGDPPRTIMVTSSIPSEGKSFVCANLGIAFAQGLEQHALLIDCDLRRPALGQLFGFRNDRGLSNYLQGEADLFELIKKTSIEKLSAIPCGPPPVNPSELLGSQKMGSLIDEVAQRYPDRYIFFDSPPLHAASETSVLAKHVDGIVIVVRWGKSSREQVRQLVQSVGKEKIISIVFNAFETNTLEKKLLSYSKTYDYYYSSNYG